MRFSVKKVFIILFVSSFAILTLSGCETGEETVAKLVTKAEQGDVGAMLDIAEIYCGGKNIEQDDQVCSIWMRRAAESGHIRAQYMLGGMYEQGLGMRASPVEAYRWYTLAAGQGYVMSGNAAQKLEENMVPSQLSQAKKLVEESIAAKKATGRYFVPESTN